MSRVVALLYLWYCYVASLIGCLFIASALDNTLDCDEGWVGYKGYCYYFSDELLTFDEAYNLCLTNHSLIVTFTMGLHEAKFVEETIQSRYRFQ